MQKCKNSYVYWSLSSLITYIYTHPPLKFLTLLYSVNLVKKQTLLLLSKLSKRQIISYLLNCTVIIYQFIFPLATTTVTLTGSCTQFSKVWQRTTSSSCFQLNQKSLQCLQATKEPRAASSSWKEQCTKLSILDFCPCFYSALLP